MGRDNEEDLTGSGQGMMQTRPVQLD